MCVYPDALCYVMWVLDIEVQVMYVKYNGKTLLLFWAVVIFTFDIMMLLTTL